MNVENINKTIDAIRFEKSVLFNMDSFGEHGPVNGFNTSNVETVHTCGTAACIAGFAVLADDRTYDIVGNYDSVPGKARAFLGLDEFTAHSLFFPSYIRDTEDSVISGYDANRNQAIAVLEHLRDTGEVDWTVADGK